MKTRITVRSLAALALCAVCTAAAATPVAVDTTSPANGISAIYSATFDGGLGPCGAGTPPYCVFFNGWPPPAPPAVRAIVINPTPSGAVNGVPAGITPTPAAGSFLDLTLDPDHQHVTIAGGVLKVPDLTLVIKGSTVVHAAGAGFVFNTTPQTTTVDANGVAEFQVSLAPATLVDFSDFPTVVDACSGPLCSLILILTLDVVRYDLIIDYDQNFNTFTASFVGQTANNSLLFATLNSTAPDIAVTDSAPPTGDLQVPFGGVTALTSSTQQITVTNSGSRDLVLGTLDQAGALAAPFALSNDNCSGQTLTPATSCTADVSFSPTSTGDFDGSFDIPSNDPDAPDVTVSVSGTGTLFPVANIVVTDPVAPTGDLDVPFGSITVGQNPSQVVTVANNGNAGLQIGQVAMANALAAPFSVVSDNCSNQTVAPLANCTFSVEFQPTAAGARSDTFDIPSNDLDTPTVTMSVSGTGVALLAPDITVTDSSSPSNDLLVGFRNVNVSTSAEQTITVTNDGVANLDIGQVGQANPLDLPFSIVTDGCSNQSIAPAGSCTIDVSFAPGAVQSYSDSLDIPSNDPDESSVTVGVSGDGGVAEVPPTPNGASSGFMALDPAMLLLMSLLGVGVQRRRRAQL